MGWPRRAAAVLQTLAWATTYDTLIEHVTCGCISFLANTVPNVILLSGHVEEHHKMSLFISTYRGLQLHLRDNWLHRYIHLLVEDMRDLCP